MRGDMAPCRSFAAILAVLSLVALSNAGPIGPLPNVTSSDVGLNEGSCVLGDVVYMPGDTFAGATPCERCACAAGSVQCAQERCEPRPGCKALHRPDHCCPTYQCECEQEGRVYGNGEKLVDPEDPCRVCYCQGGEVVCRRIACFLRDDCQPRLVKGRCCPEYDNCPLRGVTAIPGLVPPVPSISATEDLTSSAAPTPPKENIKQEITIKEITPVSEIPVITDVKIKEILPSPSIEVPEYPSSKSPLIPREAILDKTVTSSAELSPKTEESVVIELISPLPTDQSSKSVELTPETKSSADSLPSKISLSTQESINSEIYPSHIPTIIATMGVPPLTPDSIPVASTTRVAIIEEEDTSLFDHNPAFPPIPDDLSVIGTHEDEIVGEQSVDADHMTHVHGEEHVASTPSPTETSVAKEVSTTIVRDVEISTTTTTTTTTEKPTEAASTSTAIPIEYVETSTANVPTSTTAQNEASKSSPMLNLRTAIPTEILNVPSSVPEDITGEFDEPEESVTAFEEVIYTSTTTKPTTEQDVRLLTETTVAPEIVLKNKILPRSSEVTNTPFDTTTQTTRRITEIPEVLTSTAKATDRVTDVPELAISTTKAPEPENTEAPEILISTTKAPESINTEALEISTSTTKAPEPEITEAPEIMTGTTKGPEQLTTSSVSKSNIATEITSQTEFSSLPIETSDQNPHDSSESVPKDKNPSTTEAALIIELTTAKPTPELKVQRSTTTESQPFENIETTEFILTAFGSSESSTDSVEVIKVSPTQTERNAAIIDSPNTKKTNVLADLINLVGDVASISDHTDAPETALRTTTSNTFSDSEELMPVNAGYKSKNSNFNLNSITEIPLKTKNQLPVNKQKVVEIEDEDTDNIADSPPPHDKVEPTTRRPIIDNVSDAVPKNGTQKKDIEIISQSYVPTISRRPTKVVMKKSNEKPLSEASTEDPTLSTDSPDAVTASSDETTASPVVKTDSEQSSGDLSTTTEPGLGADATTTLAPAQ